MLNCMFSTIRYVTNQFEDRRSPFSCMCERKPRLGFRAGAKAIQHSVKTYPL